MYPTPKRDRDEKWFLDFRGGAAAALGVRPGRYSLGLPREATEVEAVHATYRLVEKLRREGPQLPLPDVESTGPTFAQACDVLERARRRERMSDDNSRYVFGYLKQVRAELGHYQLRAFEGTAGDDVLIDYRNRLVDEGKGPKTRANRLNTAMQVLRRAQREKWLAYLPEKPCPCVGKETLSAPIFSWYSETDFRALRADVFRQDVGLRKLFPDAAVRADYIAKRRLYLSFSFYTGLHTADLDRLDDSQASPQIGAYERRNSKSAKCIAPTWLDMPEQLKLDCLSEFERLGRPWRTGEQICGGPWPESTRTLQAAAKRLGLPPYNHRVARRSCAREYCLRGWSERDVAEVLGHVDQRMVREVYARVPVRLRSPTKIPWDIRSTREVLGGPTATGRVIRAEFNRLSGRGSVQG